MSEDLLGKGTLKSDATNGSVPASNKPTVIKQLSKQLSMSSLVQPTVHNDGFHEWDLDHDGVVTEEEKMLGMLKATRVVGLPSNLLFLCINLYFFSVLLSYQAPAPLWDSMVWDDKIYWFGLGVVIFEAVCGVIIVAAFVTLHPSICRLAKEFPGGHGPGYFSLVFYIIIQVVVGQCTWAEASPGEEEVQDLKEKGSIVCYEGLHVATMMIWFFYVRAIINCCVCPCIIFRMLGKQVVALGMMEVEKASAQMNVDVVSVGSAAELSAALAAAKQSRKPAVIDFFATWCGPCQVIAPMYGALATEYKDRIVFLKVDVDKARDAMTQWKVTSMPTFVLITSKGSSSTLVGANPEALKSGVAALR